MSLASEKRKIQFVASGTQTVFPYDFLILSESDIKVISSDPTTGVETLELLTTDYTLTGIGNSNGGNVIFVVAPTALDRITIKREVPYTQLVDYTPSGNFPAETHEGALDRLTFQTQQLQERVDRAMIAAEATTGSNFVIPDPTLASSLGKFIKVNAAGTGYELAVVVAGDIADVMTDKGDLATHTGAATIRKPVGTDGQVLVADSTDGTGQSWQDGSLAAPAAGLVFKAPVSVATGSRTVYTVPSGKRALIAGPLWHPIGDVTAVHFVPSGDSPALANRVWNLAHDGTAAVVHWIAEPGDFVVANSTGSTTFQIVVVEFTKGGIYDVLTPLLAASITTRRVVYTCPAGKFATMRFRPFYRGIPDGYLGNPSILGGGAVQHNQTVSSATVKYFIDQGSGDKQIVELVSIANQTDQGQINKMLFQAGDKLSVESNQSVNLITIMYEVPDGI